jgi:hypothetical protein
MPKGAHSAMPKTSVGMIGSIRVLGNGLLFCRGRFDDPDQTSAERAITHDVAT